MVLEPYHAQMDRWHELLTTRYVCDICLTRYFVHYHRCPACKCVGCVYPLDAHLPEKAHDDVELREMMARGRGVS